MSCSPRRSSRTCCQHNLIDYKPASTAWKTRSTRTKCAKNNSTEVYLSCSVLGCLRETRQDLTDVSFRRGAQEQKCHENCQGCYRKSYCKKEWSVFQPKYVIAFWNPDCAQCIVRWIDRCFMSVDGGDPSRIEDGTVHQIDVTRRVDLNFCILFSACEYQNP